MKGGIHVFEMGWTEQVNSGIGFPKFFCFLNEEDATKAKHNVLKILNEVKDAVIVRRKYIKGNYRWQPDYYFKTFENDIWHDEQTAVALLAELRLARKGDLISDATFVEDNGEDNGTR